MILDRYILRLWMGPFLGGLLLVLGVLLLGRALKLLETVSDSGQAWVLIGELLILTMPYFLLLTVPMAFFLSMQNTVTSLQQSSEMDALRASGVSYTRMFRSFFLVVALLWAGLTFTSMVLLPQGQLGFNNILVKVYAMKGAITFSPQRFTEGLDGVTVYVDGEDDSGLYRGVILEDARDNISVIYTAESARFEMRGDYLELRMNDGVRLEGKGADQRMLAFEHYQVTIPVSGGRWQERQSGDHVTMMTVSELWDHLQALTKPDAVAEWNRRLLLPSTVLILLFFSLPLSLTQKRSGKAGSLIVGIAVLVLVYNIQLMLHRQVSQGAYPGWSMWAAQIAMLAMGVFLWIRAEADRLPKVFSAAGEWFYLLHQASTHWFAHRWSKKNKL
ncbi:LPS export ABC transporter permease LptF [Mariprofundus ferrinatatus]|uniref:LPS export ABC transporter permease LptF n=1 Tax=Mariprofundus ferrinatatus TaxID=1921087 RepID=A0A2K8L4L9_9PROT|nr:LptF/LptG family permease [Mariprofundus ferrinatatus]ATX82052.1 LPS export ABC transporter permease LptF [Mariprofundus ferrinatatus]